MAQLGGIVMMDPEDQAAKKNFFFGGIEGCKFRRPVVPGDTLVRPRRSCELSRVINAGQSLLSLMRSLRVWLYQHCYILGLAPSQHGERGLQLDVKAGHPI